MWSLAFENNRSLVRALATSAALAAGLVLAGCNGDDISLANNAKANQPVPPKLISDMTAKDMDLQSPILVRLYKQEAELEIWKQDRSGRLRAPQDLSDLPLVGAISDPRVLFPDLQLSFLFIKAN